MSLKHRGLSASPYREQSWYICLRTWCCRYEVELLEVTPKPSFEKFRLSALGGPKVLGTFLVCLLAIVWALYAPVSLTKSIMKYLK
jgi:hypothetical protein